MDVIITNKDVANLKKFMILHSKKAKRQKLISIFAIPFEFILVGLLLDGLLKTVPLLSLISLILAVLWLIFYPVYYKKICQKEINKANNQPESSVDMKFNVTDDEKITFSNSNQPKASEIFELHSLDRIVKIQQNYIISFKEGHHIVLPLNDESTELMLKLKDKLSTKTIEEITL